MGESSSSTPALSPPPSFDSASSSSSRPSSLRSRPTRTPSRLASMPNRVVCIPRFSEIARRVPPEPQMMSMPGFSSASSPTCAASPSSTSSSSAACTRIFAPCIHRGDDGVCTSAYILTFHSPSRYASSSRSITSVLASIRSPASQAASTSAAALVVAAKQPLCILTPVGTPTSGRSVRSAASKAATMSRVVPSPPA